jgi:hypothetical protein
MQGWTASDPSTELDRLHLIPCDRVEVCAERVRCESLHAKSRTTERHGPARRRLLYDCLVLCEATERLTGGVRKEGQPRLTGFTQFRGQSYQPRATA